MTEKSIKSFIPALTGYRAIAAWMVFLFHFFPYNNPAIPQILKNFGSELHIGVDFFFVLSGFLITYRYFNQDSINFKKYLTNRFSRIYPVFFLVILLTYGFNWFNDGKINWVEFILGITLLKTFSGQYIFSGVMQSWTLTLEELFYFSAPLFFILIKRSKTYFITIPIVIICLGILLKLSFKENSFQLFQNNFSFFIIDFFVGIFTALIFLKRKFLTKQTYFTYSGIVFFFIYGFFSKSIFSYLNLHEDLTNFIKITLLAFLGIGPIIYGLITEKTFISSFLSKPFMVLLGKSSYVFYLIHMGVISNAVHNNISSNKIIVFIILNLISISIFTFIEEPINNYIRKKFSKANT